MLPAPPKPVVTLTTNKTTTYYSVHETTTAKIFHAIEAHGLRDQDGERAAGLTAAKSEMTLNGRETGALCTPEFVKITLNLVVTLPRHERVTDLSNDLRERWEHFAAAVATHEQRHVDIFANGANAAKARIEAALKNWASCAALQATVRSLWTNQEMETQKAQRVFDDEDRARVAEDRKPLQAAIEAKKAQLTRMSAEIRQLDATLEDLSRRAGAVREKVDTVNADITKANGNCSRPTERIQVLCRQYDALVASHNAVVAEHSSVVAHRNRLADEHNVLVESINALVEALNWVR